MLINLSTIGEFLSRRATILTLIYCGAFLCLGLLLAGLGPSLPSLGRNTNSPDKRMGATVTSRALGYLVGSASGPIFHKLPGNKMVAASLIIISAFCFLIPHMKNFVILCSQFFFQGLSMGMLDTGANLMTLWLHGDRCDPYIQSLHAAFAVGAVIGPGIIKSLLTAGHPINAAWYSFGCAFIPIIFGLLYFESPTEPKPDDAEVWKTEVAQRVADIERAENEHHGNGSSNGTHQSEVEMDAIPSSLSGHGASNSDSNATSSANIHKRQASLFTFTWENRYTTDYKPYATVLGVALFLCFYVGGEVATGSFLTTFALRRGLTTEDGGAFLTFIFWLLFAFGRLIAIPLSIYVAPKTILIVDLIGTFVSSCMVWAFADRLGPLTFALILYGLFMASTFPTAITLLQTVIPVTGNMTTVFIIGASLGEMLVPLLVSSNFDSTDYMSLVYVQFGSVIAGIVTMIGVGILAYKLTQQKLVQERMLDKVVDAAVKQNERYLDGTDVAPVLLDEDDTNDNTSTHKDNIVVKLDM